MWLLITVWVVCGGYGICSTDTMIAPGFKSYEDCNRAWKAVYAGAVEQNRKSRSGGYVPSRVPSGRCIKVEE